jgi:hypothetical protein
VKNFRKIFFLFGLLTVAGSFFPSKLFSMKRRPPEYVVDICGEKVDLRQNEDEKIRNYLGRLNTICSASKLFLDFIVALEKFGNVVNEVADMILNPKGIDKFIQAEEMDSSIKMVKLLRASNRKSDPFDPKCSGAMVDDEIIEKYKESDDPDDLIKGFNLEVRNKFYKDCCDFCHKRADVSLLRLALLLVSRYEIVKKICDDSDFQKLMKMAGFLRANVIM